MCGGVGLVVQTDLGGLVANIAAPIKVASPEAAEMCAALLGAMILSTLPSG